MRVLYITSKPIFPNHDGGSVAIERFLTTLLHGNIAVKHLFISTPKHKATKETIERPIAQRANSEGQFIDTSVKPLAALAHLFKSGSYNVSRFYSKDLNQRIRELLQKENYTAVILDSLFTTPYLRTIRAQFAGKIFLRTHNVEGDLWRKYANTSKGIKKWYLHRLYRDIAAYEKTCFRNVDGILSISAADSRRIREMDIQTPIELIPVSISETNELPNYQANTPYHLGSMDWQPNREAVNYILRMFKKTRERVPNIEFHIAGKNASDYYASNFSEGIHVDGFIEDSQRYARNRGILISPILSGSGIRIKILEAMGLGIPVLTTSIGAMGIDQNSDSLIIADNESSFIDEMIHLIESRQKREKIGKNALEYIRKNHNIEIISRRLVDVIQAK